MAKEPFCVPLFIFFVVFPPIAIFLLLVVGSLDGSRLRRPSLLFEMAFVCSKNSVMGVFRLMNQNHVMDIPFTFFKT